SEMARVVRYKRYAIDQGRRRDPGIGNTDWSPGCLPCGHNNAPHFAQITIRIMDRVAGEETLEAVSRRRSPVSLCSPATKLRRGHDRDRGLATQGRRLEGRGGCVALEEIGATVGAKDDVRRGGRGLGDDLSAWARPASKDRFSPCHSLRAARNASTSNSSPS